MDGEGAPAAAPAAVLPVVEGYAAWAASYDSAPNPTRDLEGAVLRAVLSHAKLPVHLFERILEVGCGTGKNSRHLSEIGRALVCVDVSAEMLVRHPRRWPNTECYKLDVRDAAAWRVPPLVDGGFDLVVCSLVLEHLNHEAMTQLFERIDQKLAPRAWVYVAELHPCKQYKGSKARIAAPDGGEPQMLEAYTHHTSDYLAAAARLGWRLLTLREECDPGAARDAPPRILCVVWMKGAVPADVQVPTGSRLRFNWGPSSHSVSQSTNSH